MSKTAKEKRVINRTTSETLRLGGDGDGVRQIQGARKKIQSSSSFQITGVSVTRVDLGEDSADDLDESHTDDISRITDNETPSFSEDSRDIDDHPITEVQPLCQAQTQYHQQIEQQLYHHHHHHHNLTTTTPAPPPSTPQQQHQRQLLEAQMQDEPRFKVVKMPNKAPYNKGRWTCFDYLDTDASNYIAYTFAEGKYVPSDNETSQSSLFCSPFLDDVSNVQTGPVNSQGLISLELPQNSNSINNITKTNKEPDISAIEVALKSKKAASQSGSTPNNNNIDRKIEEALDAVKTHLMLAVHKEVDFLKTRVSTLEGRVNELEIENSILRDGYKEKRSSIKIKINKVCI